MTRKEKNSIDNIKKIEAYEHNLLIQFNSRRKDLDILLTTVMPGQINHIKTILWVNILFIGIGAKLFEHIDFLDAYLISYLFSLSSILILLYSLISHRSIFLGGMKDIATMSHIRDDEYIKVNGIIKALEATCSAENKNVAIIKHYASALYNSTVLTILSFLTFIVMLILNN